MRLPRCIKVTGTLLFAHHTVASFSLNLSELQPISGFSEACTQAYNAPLTDCTISDFYQGSTCSPGCVAFLEDMTKRLNDECKGITAFPNTLIGMFFKRTAVQQLCAGSDNFADGSDSVGSATVGSKSATSSPRSSTSTTSTVIETSTMTADPAISSATPSSTLSTRTSIVPSSTATAGQDAGDGSSTVTAGDSQTTSPSDAQDDPTSNDASSGSGNGGAGNSNGGTVLEAAQSGSVKSIHSLSFLTTCAVLGLWLL
ncbi:MAG: hypothetical protein Q9176_007811 [Flavoplaca citrina]